MVAPRNPYPLLLLGIIYLGFVSLGLPDGTFGVAWPAMYRDLQVPIGVAGTVLVVGTLLAAVSGFSSGRVIARFRTGPVVLVSCALTGCGMLVLAQAQGLVWLYAAAVPLGLGAGAVDAGLNGYVARHYSGRQMNWLHACWGVGATLGPLVMAWALAQAMGWRGGYVALGSAQLTLAAVFLLTLSWWHKVPVRPAVAPVGETGPEVPTLSAHSWPGWLSALIFALYVAVEATLGLWASSVLVVGRGVPKEIAGVCTAAYFGSITTGRFLVGWVVERWGNRRLVVGGSLLALTGVVLFALAPPPALAAVGLVLAGLGFAPIYPGLMHEVPRRFAPDAVQTVIGRQSGAAYIGGALWPAAAGSLAQVSIEAIVWTVVGGVLLLIVAVRHLDRLTPVRA